MTTGEFTWVLGCTRVQMDGMDGNFCIQTTSVASYSCRQRHRKSPSGADKRCIMQLSLSLTGEPPSTPAADPRQLASPPPRCPRTPGPRQLANSRHYRPHHLARPCPGRQLASPPPPNATGSRPLIPRSPPGTRRCRIHDGEVLTNKSSQGRADAQRLVATRLLDRLHDPLGHFSRLQRIYPRAR